MATVNPERGEKFNYKGLTDDEFKSRYNDHHKISGNLDTGKAQNCPKPSGASKIKIYATL